MSTIVTTGFINRSAQRDLGEGQRQLNRSAKPDIKDSIFSRMKETPTVAAKQTPEDK
jgi:hypothetical protein